MVGGGKGGEGEGRLVGVSTGDFVIDLYTKIRKPTPFIYLDFEKKKDPFIYLKGSNMFISDTC